MTHRVKAFRDFKPFGDLFHRSGIFICPNNILLNDMNNYRDLTQPNQLVRAPKFEPSDLDLMSFCRAKTLFGAWFRGRRSE